LVCHFLPLLSTYTPIHLGMLVHLSETEGL
jgi:hypothetical protein